MKLAGNTRLSFTYLKYLLDFTTDDLCDTTVQRVEYGELS
jgi:hypothetical protein